MKLSVLLLISLLSVLSVSMFSVVSVLAQDSMNFNLQNYLGSWFDVNSLVKFLFPNFPDEWLRIPQVIWYVIVPFITAFTVLYGLLVELRIFIRAPKVNVTLAFAMAFLLLPSGMLTWIVTIFYAGGAFIGVMGFIVVFIVGVFIWGYGTSWRFWREYGTAAELTRNISLTNRRISQLRDEWHRLRMERVRPGLSTTQQAQIDARMAALTERITKLQDHRNDLQTQLTSAGMQ